MTCCGRTSHKCRAFNHSLLLFIIVWNKLSLQILKANSNSFDLEFLSFQNLCSVVKKLSPEVVADVQMKYFTAYIRNVRPQRWTSTNFNPKIKALTFFFAAFLQLGPSCKQTIVTETQVTQEVKFLWIRPQRGYFRDLSRQQSIGLEFNFQILYF